MKNNLTFMELHRAHIASSHIRDLQQASARLYTFEEYIRYWCDMHERHENVTDKLIKAAMALFEPKDFSYITVSDVINLLAKQPRVSLLDAARQFHVCRDMNHILQDIQDTYFCILPDNRPEVATLAPIESSAESVPKKDIPADIKKYFDEWSYLFNTLPEYAAVLGYLSSLIPPQAYTTVVSIRWIDLDLEHNLWLHPEKDITLPQPLADFLRNRSNRSSHKRPQAYVYSNGTSQPYSVQGVSNTINWRRRQKSSISLMLLHRYYNDLKNYYTDEELFVF